MKKSYWTVFEKMTFKAEKRAKTAKIDQKWPPNRQKWLYQKFEKNVFLYYAKGYSVKIWEKSAQGTLRYQGFTEDDDNDNDDGRQPIAIGYRS